jgi:hypothetical protein
MTSAQWQDYFSSDSHDSISKKSNPSLKYYVSRAYRESVRDINKAAAKFIDIPDEELLSHVRAFAIHGAQDSDTPATCQ